MSREKELAKNTIILTFGRICTQFISFILLPLYTAILEPSEYGIADLFNSYIYLLIPVISLMLDQGLFRFLIDNRTNERKKAALLTTVLVLNAIEIIIFTIIFLCLAPFIHSEYKYFILYDVSLNILLNTLMQYARGIGKNSYYAISSFISATVAVISNVILLVVFRFGALGLFYSTLISRVIALIATICMTKCWKYFNIKLVNREETKQLIKYSLPFIPNQLSWWVIGVSDKTIISIFLSITMNGIYSVANKFSTIYTTFYNIFNLSWTESVALHIKDKDAKEYLSETINTLFSLFFSVCLGIIAIMPFLFPLLINQQYEEAYNQIPILMLAVLFQVIVGLYSVIYVALKKSNEIAKTSFGAAVINIAVDIVLIKYIGLYAASISTLIAFATMAIYRYFDIKKYVDIPLKNISFNLILTTVVLTSYYYNNMLINIIVAVGVIVFAFLSNKNFIILTCKELNSKIKVIFSRNDS